MVCVPCLFIPAGLFIWYRFLQPIFLKFVYPVLEPFLAKFWDPYVQPIVTQVSNMFKDPSKAPETPASNGDNHPQTKSDSNGSLSSGEEKRKCPIASLSGKSSSKVD